MAFRSHLTTALLTLVAASPHAARAAPLFLEDLTSEYVPGQRLSFDLGLPPLTNLATYYIELTLTSDTGTPGIDYFFDVEETDAASSRYVFSSTANYADHAQVDDRLAHRLALTDVALVGDDVIVSTNVVAGTNDLVARVVIGTSPTFRGELTLTIDPSVLLLETPDATPTPVPEFASVLADTASAGEMSIVSVPELASLRMCVAGLVVGMARLRRHK